ncbi:hypothetical protein Cgig2_029998 [Carnegiea gigantea]|uniref:Uncharacterized protein n=1 Tax=Carnegiea gigantea TaxID=171969 RepID=A0A9Q1K804_9CARY|nr:hypothetical protein Cgig2_029998 [Carnegiea gigantea]
MNPVDIQLNGKEREDPLEELSDRALSKNFRHISTNVALAKEIHKNQTLNRDDVSMDDISTGSSAMDLDGDGKASKGGHHKRCDFPQVHLRASPPREMEPTEIKYGVLENDEQVLMLRHPISNPMAKYYQSKVAKGASNLRSQHMSSFKKGDPPLSSNKTVAPFERVAVNEHPAVPPPTTITRYGLVIEQSSNAPAKDIGFSRPFVAPLTETLADPAAAATGSLAAAAAP